MPTRDLERLAAAVKAARADLGLSQEDFAKRGPMSLKTVQRLEWGTVDPRASTFKKVDNAAGWPSGTARAIAEDDAPRPTPAQPSPASAGTPHEWSAAERARMRDMSMTEVQEVYETFVRRSEYLASVWMREVMRVKAEAEQAKAATQS